MKLAHPMWETPIEFKENIINVVIIENPVAMRKYVESLMNQTQGGEGEFVLSEGDTILDLSKNMFVFSDFFHMDMNDRKVLNKLYSHLTKDAGDDELYMYTAEIKSQLLQYIQRIIDVSDEELTYEDEIEVSGILKLLDVKFQQDDIDLCEKLISYLKVLRNYLGIKCIIFVNFKSFFDDREIDAIYQYILYNKFHVLFLESHCPEKIKDNEKILIIDKDMCII